MSIIKKCDRCLDTYNHYEKKAVWAGTVNGVAVININRIGTGYSTPDMYDLCPKCLNEFAEFMKLSTAIRNRSKKENEE